MSSPSAYMARLGFDPDPWQAGVLESQGKRLILLCGRQVGKSVTTAALAAHTAITQPGALVLMLAPSLKQSVELFRRVEQHLFGDSLSPDRKRSTQTSLEFHNGSRILALPGTSETIRGFSAVTLLVVDEAAYVPDELFYSIMPMLATSDGQIVLLSTPRAEAGFFYDSYQESLQPGSQWELTYVRSDECSRISPEFLREQRRRLPSYIYQREYEAMFTAPANSLFRRADLERAVDPTLRPLYALSSDAPEDHPFPVPDLVDPELRPLFEEVTG